MALEKGGRADKGGNTYENRFLVRLWIELIRERLVSIEIEPVGTRGDGVEFITTSVDGERVYYQCKASNGMENYWRPGDLNARSVFKNAKTHIQNDSRGTYHFVSPVAYDELDSLCDRTRTVSNLEDFLKYQLTNEKLRDWWTKCKRYFDEDDLHTYLLLSKCYFEQIPNNRTQAHDLETMIDILFVKEDLGAPSSIRIELETFANDGMHWGRPINAGEVLAFLEEHGFRQRHLVHDERMLTQIKRLDQAYRDGFEPIGASLFHRHETDRIMGCIHDGKSILILGKAGAGKSGCIQEVIGKLEEERITYLVLPLDKRRPTGSADDYGRSLGLLCSPVLSLHSLSGGCPCVLIFDQLDALHWTNSSTSMSLRICKEMIDQAEHLNRMENGKISCIFVVRAFDYQTDHAINNMFEPDNGSPTAWEKIDIGLLSPEDVRVLIGGSYDSLSPRLCSLLQTPSNLYIWDKLSTDSKPLIENLRQLMEAWWAQVMDECADAGFTKEKIIACRKRIVSLMRQKEVLSLPNMLFQDERKEIDILASYGVLQKSENSVSFIHQSLFDFFSVKANIDDIYDGYKHLSDIFNDPDKQTPDVRYQFLMLLQHLASADMLTFIAESRVVLNSQNIRYYFQCGVFEVISQLDSPPEEIWGLIYPYLSDDNWHTYLINLVFSQHSDYVHMLAKMQPDYSWHCDDGCLLLRSIARQQPKLAFDIIKRYGTDKFPEKELFYILCEFPSKYVPETLALFQAMLDKDPYLLQNTFALYQAIEADSPTAVYMLEALVRIEPEHREHIHLPDREKLRTYAEQYVNELLARLLPPMIQASATEQTGTPHMSDRWSPRSYGRTVEQDIVYIIQCALSWQAENDPEEFLAYLTCPTDSQVERSLQSHAMENLPVGYADQAIQWLLSDFDLNAFDEFNAEKTELSCCKRILERFSPHCSIELFRQLECHLYRWHLPTERMRAILQYRSEKHTEGYKDYYISFWGDLQAILLPALDPSRTSDKTKDLMGVLARKFPHGSRFYDLSRSEMAHFVSSPIDSHADRLSDKSWLRLIADMSAEPPKISRWHWGQRTESSPQMFARSLSHAARQDPVRFANLALQIPPQTTDVFIDAFLDALCSPDVPADLTCTLMRRLCQTPSRSLAISYARIIEHRPQENWPVDILNGLIDIAIHHSDPHPEELPVYSLDEETVSCDNLQQSSINCARGCALFAISEVLWERPDLFEVFREATTSAVEDKNPAVLFSAMRCIVPWYNVDRKYAKALFDRLLERDIRTLASNDTWPLLCRVYRDIPAYYQEKLLSAANSGIEDLSKCALEMITALAAEDDYLLDILLVFPLTTAQAQIVCRQAVHLFADESYHRKGQAILEHLIDVCDDLPQLGQLFYQKIIDPQRDREFLVRLISRCDMNRMAFYFIEYLREYDGSA